MCVCVVRHDWKVKGHAYPHIVRITKALACIRNWKWQHGMFSVMPLCWTEREIYDSGQSEGHRCHTPAPFITGCLEINGGILNDTLKRLSSGRSIFLCRESHTEPLCGESSGASLWALMLTGGVSYLWLFWGVLLSVGFRFHEHRGTIPAASPFKSFSGL